MPKIYQKQLSDSLKVKDIAEEQAVIKGFLRRECNEESWSASSTLAHSLDQLLKEQMSDD